MTATPPAPLHRTGFDHRKPSGRPRVLILTASYGEGHNAAARALAEAFDREAGAGVSRQADLFALASPRLNAVSRRMYLQLINHAPRFWSWTYALVDGPAAIRRLVRLLRREEAALEQLLRRESFDAICCTYPVYAFLLERIARRTGLRLPVYNVVTDSISIHSLWWRARCDAWFVPNPDSADVLLRAGLPAAAVRVSGFPLPQFFADNAGRLAPPDLARGERPRVLHLVNSGTRHAAETSHRLLVETDWEVTCAVGRDDALRRQLEHCVHGRGAPARILGWTNDIPRLLMTSHAVVTKAGGATTQEAIAAGCPMVVTQIVPGQEEGNFELVRRHHAGAHGIDPHAVLTILRSAFADGGQGWRRWRVALAGLARPNAAPDIARQVLAACGCNRTLP